MARLNLRPIYDRDELTGGERIARGIGTALGEYAQHQEVGRQEESKRRAAGQVMTTRGEGGIDRLRSLGRRLLGRNDAGAGRTAPASGIVDNTLPPDNPVLGTSMAPSATPVPPARMDGVSMGGVPIQRPMQAPPTVATSAVTPPPLMSQPQRPAPRTIGSAIDKYTEDDGFGNQWTVDPNLAANRRLSESAAELAQKDQFSEQGTARSVEALTAAGMPRAEAEARVRTNTVRYDQEFGQQPKPSTAMTFEQRRALSAEHDAREATIREKLARLSAAGRQNGPEALELRREALSLSRERLDMQREQGTDRARAQDVTRETGIAGAINSTLTKDPIAQSTMSPEQKAAEAKRAGQRDTHINTAASTQAQIRNSHATADQARARAQALRAAGKTPEQIKAAMTAEGYRVH